MPAVGDHVDQRRLERHHLALAGGELGLEGHDLAVPGREVRDFGKSSALGQTLKLLSGVGPIYALHFALEQLAGLAGKIAEVSDKVRSGEATWQDAVREFAEAVPVGLVNKLAQ